MLQLYRPSLDELWFREELLSDPATMEYNRAWGGAVPFPRERWAEWYKLWLGSADRFYRYLLDSDNGRFVGECAFHRDYDRQIYLADVIVKAEERGRGLGRQGLRLLCSEAKKRGLVFLYDDIAADNPSAKLFLSEGFEKVGRTESGVTLRLDLRIPIQPEYKQQ